MCALLACAWSSAGFVGADEKPRATASRALFFDDSHVAELKHLTRTMHQPQKRGAVLKPERGLREKWLQIRSAPMWIEAEGLYRMAFLSLSGSQADTLWATSRDGLKWQRPIKDEPGAASTNKVVVRDPLPKFAEPSNIVFDPDDKDPTRGYKALVGAEGRLPAVSEDGSSFRLISDRVINSSDESQLLYDRQRRRFVATLKHFNPFGRAVGLSTSEDFATWTTPRLIFGADEEDQLRAHDVINARIKDPAYAPVLMDPEPPVSKSPRTALATWSADVYNMAVFPYEDLWIGLPAIFYRTGLDANKTNTDGFHEIQLAYSHDLANWKRAGDRRPFIGPSPTAPGVFDRTQLLPTSQPISRGDELWFYYTGMKWRDSQYELNRDRSPRPRSEWRPEEIADFDEGSGAVCLAVLRRDGFVSLDAGKTEGYLLTKPIKIEANTLYLNAAAADGLCAVAVLENGEPVAGFGVNDCLPIKTDAVQAAIGWRAAELRQLHGKTVQFKITLRSASLYAFWIGD